LLFHQSVDPGNSFGDLPHKLSFIADRVYSLGFQNESSMPEEDIEFI